ncbi:intracellular growth attenuator family protein [Escherichia coli]|nr:intracellular growth attenuator family protein [Escherichia coli]
MVYPAHWQPYIAQDLGQQTDIDIYLDRHVVRQGRYLSLHDEVKTFRYSTGCAVRLSLRARCWCCLCCYSGSRWICR